MRKETSFNLQVITFLVCAVVLMGSLVLSSCGVFANPEIRRLEKQVETLEAQVDNLLTTGIEDNWVEDVKIVRRASASHLVRVWVYVDGFLTPMWEDDLDHMIATGFYIVVVHRE